MTNFNNKDKKEQANYPGYSTESKKMNLYETKAKYHIYWKILNSNKSNLKYHISVYSDSKPDIEILKFEVNYVLLIKKSRSTIIKNLVYSNEHDPLFNAFRSTFTEAVLGVRYALLPLDLYDHLRFYGVVSKPSGFHVIKGKLHAALDLRQPPKINRIHECN